MAITTERIATGFDDPLYATAPAGDTDRLFVVEQHTGQIRILDLDSGTTLATPFLTVSGITQGGEQGLLGLAFHPDYATNGLFYVNFTNAGGDTVIREYRVSAGNPSLADAASGRTILTIDQPYTNHNGGWIGFGPDGYLYVATGDGGSGGDPENHAQDITNDLLGKILRLDVDGADAYPADPDRNYAIPADNPFVGVTGDDEIWAYGLRNPWRPSFDRLTGDLYIADVGQGEREEVDFQPAASNGGENYGWKVLEGTAPFSNVAGNPPANDPSLVAPIHEYGHVGAPNGGNSITGGYVYRGPIAELYGTYFFADFISGQIWSFRYDGASKTEFQNRTTALDPAIGAIGNISSFAEDGAGNLYIIDYDGELYRIVSAAEPPAAQLSLSAVNAAKAEGTGGATAFLFTVTCSANTAGAVQVGWSVQGSGAVPASASDFAGGVLPSGVINFASGEASRQITVNVAADSAFEANEGFTVTLANPSGNAQLSVASAAATIVDDDLALVAIAASEAVKPEGNGGATPFRFTLSRSGDPDLAVSVDWSVLASGATPASGNDFQGAALPGGTISFAAGETVKELDIPVQGDGQVEPDEGFRVVLSNPTLGASITGAEASGIILNDDRTLLAIVGVDTAKAEGNSGTTPITFVVQRSGDTAVASSVDYLISGAGDAPADAADFAPGTALAGTIAFAPGELSKLLTLQVVGDGVDEADEAFVVTLSNPVGAELTDEATAFGIIRNDEPVVLPLVSIAGGAVAEGDDGMVEIVFTLTLAEPAGSPVSVQAMTADGSAVAGSDYEAKSETIVFAPGETTRAFAVSVLGDTVLEGDEQVAVILSDPDSATLAVASAIGTILNDDAGAAFFLDGQVFSDGNAAIARWGGALSDRLAGNGGNDSLMGLGQGDVLEGGSGDDLLLGDLTADGSDRLDGGDGDDTAMAGGGDDTVLGGDGADLLFGEGQADTLLGGDGDDRLFGGSGDDYLWGEAGSDTLDGGGGADLLDGGAGDDRVIADGDDLYAGGGSGRDRLVILGGGIDAIDLTAADDQNAGPGSGPHLAGFEEVDASLADGPVSVTGSGPLGAGSLVIGSRFADSLAGGTGADTLIGGGGSDLLTGDEGADDFGYVGTGVDDLAIADFTPGSDRVMLDPGLGLTPAAALAATHAVANDAVLDLGQGGSITLIGLAAGLGALAETDFALL